MIDSSSPTVVHRPSLALASRGDPLTPFLWEALARRYPIAGQLDVDLSPVQRAAVAASTFRPSRRRWAERFYKSQLGRRLRSGNAARDLHRLPTAADAVFQVHALFDVTGPTTVLYVDCTHRQSMSEWPDWNPLRGRALRRWLEAERRQYRRAAHILTLSEPTAESLRTDYGIPAHRVTSVGAGITLDTLPDPDTLPALDTLPDPLPSLDPEAEGPGPDGPTILFVGHDFVRKGGHVLLEAFRTVRAQLPDARLRIVGTPHPIEPQPGVEVLGRVSDRSRLAELYREASVFCLPSFFEPFGLVILEAMAFGLPVVATRTCGIPEMVTDGVTGLLTAKGDAEALATALVRALTTPQDAVAWGRAGRRRAEEHFTWDAVVDRMAPALDRLLPTVQTKGRHLAGDPAPARR